MAGQSSPVFRTAAFRVSCWTLGVLAFAEVMSAAVALAARLESSREVQIRYVDREVKVPQIITIPAPVAAANPAMAAARPQPNPNPGSNPNGADVVAHPPQNATPVAPKPAAPAPNPLGAPPIADPIVERLVLEARRGRVAGDNMNAITKLNEAAKLAPYEPNVEYELGLIHEDMAVFDTASEHYENVFHMGASRAGTLYELAAAKLRDGFENPKEMHGKLALGRARVFRDVNYQEGERVVLTIPVQAGPGTNVGPDDFFVTVRFFDTLRGKEIVPAAENTSTREAQWVSGAIDWAGGEELLRVTYIIPTQGAADERLFGQRTYYGQSVELTYKGELLDVQAWPRDLAARTTQQAPQPAAQPQPQPNGLPGPGDVPPEFLNKEEPVPGYNKDNPLLPRLPSR